MESLILDGHKLAWHRERVEAWLRGERIAPITIDCALTRRCNYHCVYCYGRLQANREYPLTKAVIFRFLDDAAEIGVKAISFVSDGESTLSPHLKAAILRGHDNGLDMALGTNGYRLDTELLEEILPKLTYLRFNFSGADPHRYARIMGCAPSSFEKVCRTIRSSVEIKARRNLPVTIGMQMVLLPWYADQVIPLARLGKRLGVDYLVIKHCSDDENGSLGVDYKAYFSLTNILRKAESISTSSYSVKAKWSKIMSGGKRRYSRCYGPPFLLQMSGSGLVAPCGMLFNERYNEFHIGNIAEKSFKQIYEGARYWHVMNTIASENFDARRMCGSLCLQHKVNEFLWDLKNDRLKLSTQIGATPMHVNFI
ncbi:MAG: radical SAM protein [Deltaproteobacteria bacterium]|nr:radical SAM protein [Deltaproteobacteria bacterium]MBW1949537.1 radical SAM protein [Deltaproteobacteria bacterium]MBW2346508.1 radical SAM protein [Deltaproteobacteria bacterium]